MQFDNVAWSIMSKWVRGRQVRTEIYIFRLVSSEDLSPPSQSASPFSLSSSISVSTPIPLSVQTTLQFSVFFFIQFTLYISAWHVLGIFGELWSHFVIASRPFCLSNRLMIYLKWLFDISSRRETGSWWVWVYKNLQEQKWIVPVLFMVPVYATESVSLFLLPLSGYCKYCLYFSVNKAVFVV